MQELEKKLKRLRALRKFREVEQLRLAAELHAHEQRLRQSTEAAAVAARFLEDDLPLGGLLARQGLREAAASLVVAEDERRIIRDISHRNARSKSIKDALVEKEAHLAAEFEQRVADEALMETVATWPAILRVRDEGEG